LNRVLGALVVLLAVSSLGLSQTPPGFNAATYARRGIDARPAAMGGAFVAIAEGSAGAYYNPAGLSQVGRLGVGGMYSEPFGKGFGVTYQYFNASGALGVQSPSNVGIGVQSPSNVGIGVQSPSNVGIGAGVTWIGLTVADIPIWDEQETGATFTATSSLYEASAGTSLGAGVGWSVGASLKYYSEQILEGRGEGLGLDVGLLGSFSLLNVPVRIGVNAMDVTGTRIQWKGTAGNPVNYVPLVVKAGIAIGRFDGKVLVACDIDWAVGRPQREQTLHSGLELQPVEGLFLRAGWNTDLVWQGSVTAGVGIRAFDRLEVDYAYIGARVFKNASHLISARFSF